ncbi:MAG: P-loop NTPase [Pirellulaceae bacterium]|nr:P-loop NTPase [Pirellulaceae bacterium]
MSKSLNQAFIKAYSKESARAPAQPRTSSPKMYGNDDLMIRFDTATCGSISAPHLKASKRLKETVVTATVSPRSAKVEQPARPQAAHTKWPDAPPSDFFSAAQPKHPQAARMTIPQVPTELDRQKSDSNEALRSAIAAQMSRAGDWGDSSTEPFLGEKPIHSTGQTRQAVLSGNGDSLRDQPAKPMEIKELDTPKLLSPALLSQQSSDPGEFFRLDRPSYVPAPVPLDDALPIDQLGDTFDDSGELSSEIFEHSSNRFDLESRSKPSAVPLPHASSQAVRVEQTQSVERELRRAKLRIFNPVWEVDSFQWPDICLELLEQRADSLDAVARKLNEAVQEGLQVLAITSPQGGEGRTTVACCLAKLAGSRGLNVAIVDGDIENPSLSYQTNLDLEQDWKTAILNQLPLEEIAVHSIDDQVTLVPLIGPIDQSEMAAGDNRIEFMLHELSESFDLVIVDMGHMSSPRSLVSSLGARGVISAVVAVVDHRTADAQQIDLCLRRIRQSGVASIGVVENFAA